MKASHSTWALVSLVPLLFGINAVLPKADVGRTSATVAHDVVVDPQPLRAFKIPARKDELEKKLRVLVRNADPKDTPPFVVRLVVGDGDCPAGTVSGVPDFGRKAGIDPQTIELPPGRAAVAAVPIRLLGSAFTSHNARTPTRCTLAVEARPEDPGHLDPTPGNAAIPLALDVIDLADPEETTLHESVADGVRPIKIKIPRRKTGLGKTVTVRVASADVFPEPEEPGHEITLSAEDGDCPPGTVGAVDFDRRQDGAQGTALVAGAKRAAARLELSFDGAAFLTPNPRSPARCTARLRATGPAGNVEPEPSNDIALVVIDVIDQADEGLPTPTPEPSATPEPTASATPTAEPTPSPTPSVGPLPPEPSAVAPPVDESVATDLFSATRFLYESAEPIQSGVAAGTIEPRRAAVVSGRVLDRSGAPLPGVAVTILDHPDLGQTLSRASGGYDLAVNGGGPLTADFRRAGFIPVQRTLDVPWRSFAVAPDVVMIARDAAVTTIDLDAAIPFQVARGSEQTDDDGPRRATLLFAQGTQAELVMPDGGTTPISTLNVRATEYTVGDSGPDAMPAELPPTSGYTYAVELGVDEAIAAGAKEVRFDRPVLLYLENFLGFPVGMQVPTALYDQSDAAWVPVDDGRVIEVVGESGGLAEIDTDGDGTPDAGLGIGDAERAQVAALYAVGQSLWRVAVTHFTPCDPNIPIGGPDDAVPPDVVPEVINDAEVDIPGLVLGHGAIEAENQTLRESLPLVGTPLRLAYSSERAPGRRAHLRLPVTGTTVPPSLRKVRLRAYVQGAEVADVQLPPLPDQAYEMSWNGRDRYGRRLQGRQPLDVRIEYVYDAFYQVPASRARSFGYPGDAPIAIPARRPYVLTQILHETIASSGGFDARGVGLGGWMLDAHHVYEPEAHLLEMGDGTRRSATNANVQVFERFAGGGTPADGVGDGLPAREAELDQPFDVATGPDGSVYVSDRLQHRVRRVAPDGVISTIAGTGSAGYNGDGIPATSAEFDSPSAVAVGADGSVYVADSGNQRVRRIAPDGTIATVAGNGSFGSSGDDGPATGAQLAAPTGLAVAADGTLFVTEWAAHKLRRVGPDGTIGTLAGTGIPGYNGDGIRSSAAQLDAPLGLALGPDGSLYVADSGNNRVRRIFTDGTIVTVAGTGSAGDGEDGQLATACDLDGPSDVALGPDGSLFVAEQLGGRVRRVRPDGIISTAVGEVPAGGYARGPLQDVRRVAAALAGLLAVTEAHAAGVALPRDGLPATAVTLGFTAGVAVLPDGTLFVSDSDTAAVFRVAPPLPGFSATDVTVPSVDGTLLYQFDQHGRHLATRDALTLGTLLSFGYDGAGRLVSVTDHGGRQLAIERDGGGTPTAIVAPDGQRTTLTLDADGYLQRITNPAGESVEAVYADGLVTSLVSSLPGATPHTFEWDAQGLLTRASDPEGGSTSYVRSEILNGARVTQTTALGRVTIYDVTESETGRRTIARTDPSGAQTVLSIDGDGVLEQTNPDGSSVRTTLGPDPRFYLQAPVQESQTLAVPHPGGMLTLESTAERTATLADPLDPLSVTEHGESVTVNGKTWRRDFEAAAGTYTDTSPEGRTVVTRVDPLGRPTAVETDGFPTARYAYDGAGRLSSESLDAGAEVRSVGYTYGANGQIESVTDPLGRTVVFAYDAAARVVRHTLLDGSEVAYDYDARGYRTGITPPGRPVHQIEYDQRGLVTTYRPPDVGTTEDRLRFVHSADGEPTSVVRLDGTTVGFEHDAAGRIAAQSLPDGGRVEYAYDPLTGALAGTTSADGVSHAVTYLGFLSSETTWSGPIAGSISRTYDGDLRLSRFDVAGAAPPIVYEYDSDNLITAVGDGTTGGVLRLERSVATARVDGTSFGPAPAPVDDTRTYGAFGELSDLVVSCAGSPCYAVHYERDLAGQIVEKAETVAGVTRTRRYTYDVAGHVAEVRDGSDSLLASYTYDANDNRLTGPGAATPATYDDQDRLLSYGDTTYAYTDDGELRTRTTDAGTPAEETTTYRYDALGNLKQVDLPDGRVITYLVDGLNRRVAKQVDGSLAQGFLYAGPLKPIAELDATGAVETLFLYATRAVVPDVMLRREGADWAPYRIVSDALGSPRLVVDADDGSVVQRIEYDTYGRVETDTNPGFQPFGFAGGLYDPDTGLVRFGVRDYDAETGRFTAKDPVLFLGLNPNLYAYCFNDPVNLADPAGTSPLGRLWEDITDDDPWFVDAAPFVIAGAVFFNYESGGVLGDVAQLGQDAAIELSGKGLVGVGPGGATPGSGGNLADGLSKKPYAEKSNAYTMKNLANQQHFEKVANMKAKVTSNQAKTPKLKKVKQQKSSSRFDRVSLIIGATLLAAAYLTWLGAGGK